MHEIEADAIGPDLQRGIVTVARQRKQQPAEAATAEVNGSDVGTEGLGAEQSTGGADPVVPTELGGGAGDIDLTDDPWLPPLAGSAA
jgi:hypothetical protein